MGNRNRRAQRGRLRWLGLVAALLVVGGARLARASHGAEGPARGLEQSDTDGDGAPDVAFLWTDGANGIRRVVAYDRGQPMSWEETWQAATAGADDAWVMEDGSGTAKLVICFSQSGGRYHADLYDDVDGDRAVAYRRLSTGDVEITESAFPSLRMTADRPWILPDGSTNTLIQAVGYRAERVAGVEVPFAGDGSPAYEIDIRDTDGDGAPDYELVRYFPDIPDEWRVPRTYLNVRVDESAPAGFAGYFLWPFLDADPASDGDVGSLVRAPGDLRPPIRVDWENARIVGVADLLPRWGDGMHWLFNSFTSLRKGETNSLAFERFGQYRFSDSAYPDMIIRHSLAQSGFGDATGSGDRPLYTDQVSISWHQGHVGSLVWDYKLELAGLQPVADATVQFADFALREVPYEAWPAYFTEQPWAYATFVDTEGHGYATDEAIYEWTTVEGALLDSTTRQELPGAAQGQVRYLLGQVDETPARFYPDIREGFRGEYADLNGRAALYIDPVDHKLHLSGAGHGVWNLGGDAEIRYANLDGDPCLDQWQVVHRGQVTRQLNRTGAFLAYSDGERAIVKHAAGVPAAQETLPPRTREEWLSLGATLGAAKRDWLPEDLVSMLEQFEGPLSEIRGAKIEAYRPVGTGFRFVLVLEKGYSESGEGLVPVTGLKPGRYLVAYDRRFSVVPLTGAAPAVTVRLADGEAHLSRAPFVVEVSIANGGLEDALGLTLVARATSEGQSIEFARKDVTALAGEVSKTLLTWQPPARGRWAIRAELISADGAAQVGAETWVDVVETPGAVPLAGSGAVPWRAGLLLGLTAVLTGGIVVRTRRARSPGDGA